MFFKIPEADKQTEMGKAISGQLIFAKLAEGLPSLDVLKQKLSLNPQDYDARFDTAVNSVTLYQYEDD